MRLVSRIPADRGRVAAITVQVRYDGTEDSDAVDVTDLQLQPGEASGVVPHPADVRVTAGAVRWRNGVIPGDTDEVIALSNDDRAAPTRIEVTPSGAAAVKVGSFNFGTLRGAANADGAAGTASAGYGRTPLITERSDGYFAVSATRSLHLRLGWVDRG